MGVTIIRSFLARSKKPENGMKMDILLISAQINPEKGFLSKSIVKKYVHGLNDYLGLYFKLGEISNELVHINQAPTSNPPTTTESFGFSLGGEVRSTGISLSGGVNFNTTTYKNALVIESNRSEINNSYKIGYDYVSRRSILGGNADTNIWLGNSHLALFGILYDTPTTIDYITVPIEFTASFNVAITAKNKYKGNYAQIASSYWASKTEKFNLVFKK